MEQIVLCVIPEEPVFSKIKSLMNECSIKLGSKKALKFPPHLTLVGRFKTDKLEQLKKALQEFSKKITPFEVNLTGFHHFDSKIIFLKPTNLNNLKKMHNVLLDLVLEYKESWTRNKFLNGTFSKKQKEYVNKYDTPYVKEFYNPHLTIAGPDVNEELSEIIKENELFFSFSVDKIKIMRKQENNWIVENI